MSSKNISLPSATKLGQGYIFTRVSDSVHRGSGGSLSWGSLSGGSLSRVVSVPGGLCLGGLCPGGLCPRGSLSGVSVWGSLSRGSLSQGGLCLGVLCPRGSISRRGIPCTVTSGRYASYWNAFLLILHSHLGVYRFQFPEAWQIRLNASTWWYK